jgi:hypothetical protein
MIAPEKVIRAHMAKTLPSPDVIAAIISSAGIHKRIPRTSAPSIRLKISGTSEPDPGK